MRLNHLFSSHSNSEYEEKGTLSHKISEFSESVFSTGLTSLFYIFDASGSFSLWSFIHTKHFLRFSHLDAGASYDEADVRRFFFLYGISTVKGSSGDISCEPLFPAISPADKGWQKNNVSLR